MITKAKDLIDQIEDVVVSHETSGARTDATASLLIDLLKLGVKIARQALGEGAFD